MPCHHFRLVLRNLGEVGFERLSNPSVERPSWLS
jgi:hypothetical protein